MFILVLAGLVVAVSLAGMVALVFVQFALFVGEEIVKDIRRLWRG